jgi:hypothetical protein
LEYVLQEKHRNIVREIGHVKLSTRKSNRLYTYTYTFLSKMFLNIMPYLFQESAAEGVNLV